MGLVGYVPDISGSSSTQGSTTRKLASRAVATSTRLLMSGPIPGEAHPNRETQGIAHR
jgi:hypothetical protein